MSYRVSIVFVALLLGALPLCYGGGLGGEDQPTTPKEYWLAIRRNLNFDGRPTAVKLLKDFLATNPAEADLLKLEEEFGLQDFLRMRNIVDWGLSPKNSEEGRQASEELIGKINVALRKLLSDRERILKFVDRLRATPEEREFAIAELVRSGDLAMPTLVEVLLKSRDEAEVGSIVNILPQLRPETVPPLLAVVDVVEPAQKVQLLESILARPGLLQLVNRVDTDITPTLAYLAANPKFPPALRTYAQKRLLEVRRIAESDLPSAKVELTELARSLYAGQAALNTGLGAGDQKTATIWRVEAGQLKRYDRPLPEVQRYYAIRFARWALELDPSYEPAQVVFLSTALSAAMEQVKYDPTQLAQAAPEVYAILSLANTDTLTSTLRQAMRQRKTALVLGLTYILGQRAEKAAATGGTPVGGRAIPLPADQAPPGLQKVRQVIVAPNPQTRSSGTSPPLLFELLDYPDRRVQLTAAEAIVRVPGPPPPGAASKLVEVLRRLIAAEPPPQADPEKAKLRAIIADPDQARAAGLSDLLQKAGYDTLRVRTGRDLLRRLSQASDVDLIVVDHHLHDSILPHTLGQLRADAHNGLLPVLVVASLEPVRPLPIDRTTLLTRVRQKYARAELIGDQPFTIAAAGAKPGVAVAELLAFSRDLAASYPNLAVIEQPGAVIVSANRQLEPSENDKVIEYLAEGFGTINILSVNPTIYYAYGKPAPSKDRQIRMRQESFTLERLRAELREQRFAKLTLFDQQPLVLLQEADPTRPLPNFPDPRLDKLIERYANVRVISTAPLVATARTDYANKPLSELLNRLNGLTRNYANVRVIPEPYTLLELRAELTTLLQGDAALTQLPDEDKAALAKRAMLVMRKLALGEVPGYDIRPAAATLREALRSAELAPLAIEVVGQLPGKEAQQDLAAFALTQQRPPELRSRAASELAKHIQRHGNLLTRPQVQLLDEQASTEANPQLRASLLDVLGSLRPTTQRNGELIQRFDPLAPPSREAPPTKEQEK